LDKLQDAKKQLVRGDRLFIEAKGGEDVYEVDLERTWSPTATIDPNNMRETSSHGELILTVRKPDMFGNTQWQFRHGQHNLQAPVHDTQWLKRYFNREIDLRPGDALRCWVKFVYIYDPNGVLKDQRTEIEQVYEVIPGPGPTRSFEYDA
jgi:hypothetical protein